jgi:HNH endonuclease
MPSNKTGDKKSGVTEALRIRLEREKSYRERALKLFPKICGRCGREFSGKRLRELTVHHKDHDHNNNPPDGSNWELLCIYCHENEHARNQVADAYATESGGQSPDKNFSHKPFAELAELMKDKKKHDE